MGELAILWRRIFFRHEGSTESSMELKNLSKFLPKYEMDYLFSSRRLSAGPFFRTIWKPEESSLKGERAIERT